VAAEDARNINPGARAMNDKTVWRDERVTTAQIAVAGLKLTARSLLRSPLVWIVAFVLFTGTNLVDLVYGAGPGKALTALQIVSLAVRLFSNIWIVVVALRTFLDRRTVWALDRSFLTYVAFFIVYFGVGLGIASVVGHALSAFVGQGARAVRVTAVLSMLVAYCLLTIRIMLWPTALALGDRSVGLRESWRRTRGATLTMIGAFFALLPIAAVHFGLTAWATTLPLSGDSRLIVTICDGVLSVVQVMLAMAFAAAIYKILGERAAQAPN
jgi:hypothetical protein